MASAAEQLAANINWSAFSKAEELKKRIWFTLGALVVFRLGTYIPLPGIDPNTFEQSFLGQKQGVLDMFNMFSGGAVQRMAVFALNIMPYISASIIIQLLSSVLPSLEAIKKEGEQGRKVLNQYTRYLTVVLALFQAYGIAIGLEGRAGVVGIPGFMFRFSTMITLTGGTMFLVWLGEQITSRGVGNGASLIIFAGIVARLPQAAVQLFELGRQGSISTGMVLAVIVMVFVVVAFIVFMERAQRRVPITYPRRQVGNKMYEGQSSFLPLKLNTSGVIPPIFASSLLLLPTTVANFAQGAASNGILSTITNLLGRGGIALPSALCRADRLLRLLLYGDGVQSQRHRREPQEAWRLRARRPAGRAHRPVHRPHPHPHHRHRRRLSGGDLHPAGAADLLFVGPALFRRHVAADRRQRDDGHGGADPWPSAGPSV